ncbi:MAG TPA: D-tagatose-bisphosphate aldolase, class II, non-catalytic subunit [Devosia sp.]|jgi:D-tagatose-1,6-bisphosphate aldolase subunit GatZ/KbaZ|nr:D-tagatose-bisphosphate aldolase, class II, non-catalytic subunit [Devosia sp.]
MRDPFFASLIAQHDAGAPRGIASVCSAHPVVLEAALANAAATGEPVLIEATCNQVNQEGGYTGMRPADFRRFVGEIAGRVGIDPSQLILGGDHLGPNPWRHLPAAEAMEKAEAMVAEYAAAGFTKIHLDASMSCGDDPTPLPGKEIARRAARLAAIAERHAGGRTLAYVIGTEVPVPGGATEHVDDLEPTSPTAAAETVSDHREAFAAAGIANAFERVIGLVVQPGVEFGHENVVLYNPDAARPLIAARKDLGLLYEAHSTDYQSTEGLRALVRDGFGILKVGPWLTFALREALYGLDSIARELGRDSRLREGMEALMLSHPTHWQRYYPGDAAAQRLQRHYSYSDRIRYYWAMPEAQELVRGLLAELGQQPIPETLISQYLPALWPEVVSGRIAAEPHALLLASVTRVVDLYAEACRP